MTGRKPNNIKLTTFLWFMYSTELDTSRHIRGQQYDHLCSFTCPSFLNKKNFTSSEPRSCKISEKSCGQFQRKMCRFWTQCRVKWSILKANNIFFKVFTNTTFPCLQCHIIFKNFRKVLPVDSENNMYEVLGPICDKMMHFWNQYEFFSKHLLLFISFNYSGL